MNHNSRYGSQGTRNDRETNKVPSRNGLSATTHKHLPIKDNTYDRSGRLRDEPPSGWPNVYAPGPNGCCLYCKCPDHLGVSCWDAANDLRESVGLPPMPAPAPFAKMADPVVTGFNWSGRRSRVASYGGSAIGGYVPVNLLSFSEITPGFVRYKFHFSVSAQLIAGIGLPVQILFHFALAPTGAAPALDWWNFNGVSTVIANTAASVQPVWTAVACISANADAPEASPWMTTGEAQLSFDASVLTVLYCQVETATLAQFATFGVTCVVESQRDSEVWVSNFMLPDGSFTMLDIDTPVGVSLNVTPSNTANGDPLWVSTSDPTPTTGPVLEYKVGNLALVQWPIGHGTWHGFREDEDGGIWHEVGTQRQVIRACEGRFGEVPYCVFSSVSTFARSLYGGSVNKAMHALNGNTLFNSDGDCLIVGQQAWKRLEADFDTRYQAALDAMGGSRYFLLSLLDVSEPEPDATGICEEDGREFDAECEDPPETRPPAKTRYARRPNSTAGMGSPKPIDKKELDQAALTEATRVAKAATFESVASRLRAAIRTSSDLARWYLARKPSLTFVRRVFGSADLVVDRSVETAWLLNELAPTTVKADLVLWALLSIPEMRQVRDHDVFPAWFETATNATIEVAKTWLDERASARNALMHALNGNIDGHKAYLARSRNRAMHSAHGNTTWAEWDKLASLHDTIMHGGATTRVTSAIDRARQLAGYLAPVNIRDVDVPGSTRLNAQLVDEDNTMVPYSDSHPESLLCPRLVSEPLINGDRLAFINIATQLLDSPELEVDPGVKTVVTDATGKYVRNENTNPNGMRLADVITLAQEPTPFGGSFYSANLKLELYRQVLGWSCPSSALPMSDDNKVDNRRMWTGLPHDLTYNTSPVYNESCTGPVGFTLPFDEAGEATVYFHASLASVPRGERTNVVFAPLGVLSLSELGSEGAVLPLLAMAFAPYPCGFWVVEKQTAPRFGVGLDSVPSIPWSNLVCMGGATELHILLPQEQGVRRPETLAAALESSRYVPTAGPNGAGLLAANQVLAVSIVGNVIGYSLADWLATWLLAPSPIDHMTITRFIKYFTDIHQRYADAAAALAASRDLSVRYPQARVEFHANLYPANNAGVAIAWQMQTAHGRLTQRTAFDFPTLRSSSFDYLVPGTSMTRWSQIAGGVKIAAPDGGSPEWYHEDGGPYETLLAMMAARTAAAAWQIIMLDLGVPAQVWRDLMANSNFKSVRESLSKFFVQTKNWNSGDIPTAPYAGLFKAVRESIVGYPDTLDSLQCSLFSYGCWPAAGFPSVMYLNGAGFIDDTNTELVCPLMSDAWLQITCCAETNTVAVLPLPKTQTRGYTGSQMVTYPFAFGNISLPIDEGHLRPAVGTNEWPTLGDKTRRNARLFWHSPFRANLAVATYDGATLTTNDGVISTNMLVCFPAWPDLFIPGTVPSRTAANEIAFTGWLPVMLSSGRRVVIKTTANASAVSGAIAGRSYINCRTITLNNKPIEPTTYLSGGESTDPYGAYGARSTFSGDAGGEEAKD